MLCWCWLVGIMCFYLCKDVQSEEEIDEKERKELKKQVVHALTDGNHYNQDNAGDVVTDEEQTAGEVTVHFGCGLHF